MSQITEGEATVGRAAITITTDSYRSEISFPPSFDAHLAVQQSTYCGVQGMDGCGSVIP